MAVSQVGALIDFTAGTAIVSSDVDSNFAALKAAFNALVTASEEVTVGKVHLTSITTGITASTTQSQGQGALTSLINIVATVANSGDTCTLPVAAAGKICFVANHGANSMQLFPASGDSINGAASAVNISVGAGRLLFAVDATNWYWVAQ